MQPQTSETAQGVRRGRQGMFLAGVWGGGDPLAILRQYGGDSVAHASDGLSTLASSGKSSGLNSFPANAMVIGCPRGQVSRRLGALFLDALLPV